MSLCHVFGIYITSGTICTTTTRITRPLLLTPSSVDCIPTYPHSVLFWEDLSLYSEKLSLLWSIVGFKSRNCYKICGSWTASRHSGQMDCSSTLLRPCPVSHPLPWLGLEWNQLHGIPESPASFSAWVGEKLPHKWNHHKSISWDMPGVRRVFRLLSLSTPTCHYRSWLLLVLASFELSLISRFQSCYAHICLLSILIQNYPDIS